MILIMIMMIMMMTMVILQSRRLPGRMELGSLDCHNCHGDIYHDNEDDNDGGEDDDNIAYSP